MRIVHRTLLMALIVFMTMGLACDSNDNGNGGAADTPAAQTYSKADLTGKWTLVETAPLGTTRAGVLGFNERGQIILWYFPSSGPMGPPNSGTIKVSPDGKITGAVTMMNDVFKFDLQFQPDGSIKGKMFYMPGGPADIYIWQLTRK